MPLSARLHPFALWCVILIPLAASVSRFAADLLLVLTCVAFMLHAALERRTDWLNIRWFQLAIALWLYVLLRGFFVDEWESSVGRALSWARFPLFAIALQCWVLQDSAHLRKLVYGLSVAVGFMLIDTAIQYFAGIELLGREPIPAEGSPRLTGPYSSPRIGIMLVWMAIPCMAYWLMQEGGGTRRGRPLLLGAFFSIGTLTVIFMSGERMALLLTGLAFVLAFLMLPISKRIMLGMGAAGAALVALLAATNPGLVDRHLGSTQEVVGEFSGSLYGQIWESAWEMSTQNPVFGVGLRQFRERCAEAAYGAADALSVEQRCNQHPHNIYLEWLAESGVIGLGLFVLIFAVIARQIVAQYRTLKLHPLFIGLLITLFIRLWPLASNTSFFTAWSAVPFWLMVGWLLAIIHRHRKETNDL